MRSPPSAAAKDRAPRAQLVHKLAREVGFTLVGIAPAEATNYEEHIRKWIATGQHGEMAYLKDQLDERLDPCRLVSGAKSIICVAEEYAKASGASGLGSGE